MYGEDMLKVEKIEYHDWPNCYLLSNGRIDLIVTTDVGLRIIHFGFTGEENELGVFPDMLGKTGGSEWRVYGGHRLWHAPEDRARSYVPDNSPVKLERNGDMVRLIQPVEAGTGIEKEMEITLAADAAQVTIVHRLRSHNLWPVTLAPWAITVMEKRGIAILPLPRGEEGGLLPSGTIALWPYTSMSDARWTWGHRYIMLRQDPENPYAQKAGVMSQEGWIAYARGSHLMVKLARAIPGALYPDFGCNIESYTVGNGLEIETVAPLVVLQPGDQVEHTEHWHLFDNIPMPAADDDVQMHILPKIREAQGS
jgi:hypothetical protein